MHKALAGLDPRIQLDKFIKINFNPQGPRGPRPDRTFPPGCFMEISIHKALAGLDVYNGTSTTVINISIHKALAGLDFNHSNTLFKSYISIHKALAGLDPRIFRWPRSKDDFNPQGPRGPRPLIWRGLFFYCDFNPQGPRGPRPVGMMRRASRRTDFNPQGPRGPRQNRMPEWRKRYEISIHKALAGLDLC
ncbi:hypothetical protein HMPREF1090_02810 [[Clostridium] clostridioforme 90A8]|uniref:Uncharacterized protein n=1 Tax=[Clostridium] clostridioforme 90A8 TaxID=999408 RepID=A0A0E2H9T4_9FIRM|nr:hypothetical protein HMPREF1090_02810 [[Clostridium] clostridioforme 90A8]